MTEDALNKIGPDDDEVEETTETPAESEEETTEGEEETTEGGEETTEGAEEAPAEEEITEEV